MPLPFILAGAAVAAGAFGAKKAYDASERNAEARYAAANAQRIVKTAKQEAEAAKSRAQALLVALGQCKADVLTRTMPTFLRAFEQVHHIELTDSAGIRELEKFRLHEGDLPELREMGAVATSFTSGAASGATLGGLMAFGAYSGIGALGAASTGTAIAGLSGAAATNATRAWLGGGSLAAGGFGVAGGTVVLGGLVAGPAIAILGWTMDSRSRENLARAEESEDQARAMAAELAVATDLCDGITARSRLFSQLIGRLDAMLLKQTGYLYRILRAFGTDYRTYNPAQRKVVACALSAAGALKAAIDTPILNEDGSLTEASQGKADELIEAARLLPA